MSKEFELRLPGIDGDGNKIEGTDQETLLSGMIENSAMPISKEDARFLQEKLNQGDLNVTNEEDINFNPEDYDKVLDARQEPGNFQQSLDDFAAELRGEKQPEEIAEPENDVTPLSPFYIDPMIVRRPFEVPSSLRASFKQMKADYMEAPNRKKGTNNRRDSKIIDRVLEPNLFNLIREADGSEGQAKKLAASIQEIAGLFPEGLDYNSFLYLKSDDPGGSQSRAEINQLEPRVRKFGSDISEHVLQFAIHLEPEAKQLETVFKTLALLEEAQDDEAYALTHHMFSSIIAGVKDDLDAARVFSDAVEAAFVVADKPPTFARIIRTLNLTWPRMPEISDRLHSVAAIRIDSPVSIRLMRAFDLLQGASEILELEPNSDDSPWLSVRHAEAKTDSLLESDRVNRISAVEILGNETYVERRELLEGLMDDLIDQLAAESRYERLHSQGQAPYNSAVIEEIEEFVANHPDVPAVHKSFICLALQCHVNALVVGSTAETESGLFVETSAMAIEYDRLASSDYQVKGLDTDVRDIGLAGEYKNLRSGVEFALGLTADVYHREDEELLSQVVLAGSKEAKELFIDELFQTIFDTPDDEIEAVYSYFESDGMLTPKQVVGPYELDLSELGGQLEPYQMFLRPSSRFDSALFGEDDYPKLLQLPLFGNKLNDEQLETVYSLAEARREEMANNIIRTVSRRGIKFAIEHSSFDKSGFVQMVAKESDDPKYTEITFNHRSGLDAKIYLDPELRGRSTLQQASEKSVKALGYWARTFLWEYMTHEPEDNPDKGGANKRIEEMSVSRPGQLVRFPRRADGTTEGPSDDAAQKYAEKFGTSSLALQLKSFERMRTDPTYKFRPTTWRSPTEVVIAGQPPIEGQVNPEIFEQLG